MSLQTIPNDVHIAGNLSAQSATLPAGTVNDAAVAASAGIAASKLDHQYLDTYNQAHGVAAATIRIPIKVAYAAGEIVNFRAGVVVAAVGAATVSIRLKKNGSNIDTAALVIDNANAAFAKEDAAGFTSTTYVAGDVFEADITATAGGGTLPQGLFCQLITREDAV